MKKLNLPLEPLAKVLFTPFDTLRTGFDTLGERTFAAVTC
jgi:hypothetical protein